MIARRQRISGGVAIQFSESFEIEGKKMYEHACKVGFEGVVSRVPDSKYPIGRSNDWVKETCAQRELCRKGGPRSPQ
jgi:bifunctional non-homologous end joining protein LigD